jgi:hypothetical protein
VHSGLAFPLLRTRAEMTAARPSSHATDPQTETHSPTRDDRGQACAQPSLCRGKLLDALAHYGESLPHDSDDASPIRVPLRFLFEVAPNPGAFWPGQQCVNARLTFRQRSIVQIGRIVYVAGITGGVYLDVEHAFGHDSAITAAGPAGILVSKLKEARERKRAAVGKCEGRKSHAELRPDVVTLARLLRRKRPKGGQRSLRDVAAELAQRGHRLARCARPET